MFKLQATDLPKMTKKALRVQSSPFTRPIIVVPSPSPPPYSNHRNGSNTHCKNSKCGGSGGKHDNSVEKLLKKKKNN